MNTQGKWSYHYRLFMDTDVCNNRRRVFQRQNMYDLRREAALERICAAQQRTIQAQAQAAKKFSGQHYNTPENDPQVDPQDWYEFDKAFGIVNDHQDFMDVYPNEGDEMNGLQREAAGL